MYNRTFVMKWLIEFKENDSSSNRNVFLAQT